MSERNPIKVSVGLSYTINMGNYESFKIDLGVEDYQQPGETAKEAHERVFNFVNKRLAAKVEKVRKELEDMESQGGY